MAFCLLFTQWVPACLARNPLRFELLRAKSGAKYSFVYLNDAPVRFVTERPKQEESQTLLVIPAAFTTLEGRTSGVYVANGTFANTPNTHLGGALRIENDSYQVLDTKSGATLTKDYLAKLAGSGGGLFQQFTVVKNGTPSSFKDKSKFQRRGIGKLKNGGNVVVESKEEISLGQFGQDLVELGVSDLLYTDMGAWGEGWVRDPKDAKVIRIGNDNQLTGKQTNWIKVVEPAK